MRKTMHRGLWRAGLALATTGTLALGGLTATAQAQSSGNAPAQASDPVYFVHGYSGESGTDCKDTWGNAWKYFVDRGWDSDSMSTVGYYQGDKNCDVTIGDGSATTDTRIKDLAADFANYIYDQHTSKGESIDIVAHSMGGLITRVALLGSAQGWSGFPHAKLKVANVVTLGTPHQGVRCDDDQGDGKDECPNTSQWLSMDPDSEFMKVLHESENRLSQDWAAGTDWSFVGSDEDDTVSGDSAIDKNYHADHKYRYLTGNDHEVTHSGIRELYGDTYNLRYWHASDGESHDTTNGWAPLKTAYNALYYGGDW